jgi:hypothetical protein
MLPVDFSSSFPGDEISVSVFMRRRIPAGLWNDGGGVGKAQLVAYGAATCS